MDLSVWSATAVLAGRHIVELQPDFLEGWTAWHTTVSNHQDKEAVGTQILPSLSWSHLFGTHCQYTNTVSVQIPHQNLVVCPSFPVALSDFFFLERERERGGGGGGMCVYGFLTVDWRIWIGRGCDEWRGEGMRDQGKRWGEGGGGRLLEGEGCVCEKRDSIHCC